MASLFRRLADLGRSWWRVDRIRVSGRRSRLLRLPEGSALRVGATQAVVLARTVLPSHARRENEAGVVVCYSCLTATGLAELEVRPLGQDEPPELRWRTDGRERRVEDVVPYASLKSPLRRGRLWHVR